MQGYTVPLSPEGRAPLYEKPPKRFGGRVLTVVFKARRDALAALIPPPLELPDDPIAMVRINELLNDQGKGAYLIENEPELVQYNEAVVAIPAVYQGRVGNYDPYLWVDNDSCAAGGREIYGLPKKMGQVYLTRFYPSDPFGPGVRLTGTCARLSRRLITASVRITGQAKPSDLPRIETFFGLRIIPNPSEDRPDIHQLLEFKLQNYTITELWGGEASLTFGDSPTEELTALEPTEIIGGFYSLVDWILPWATVVHDYLREPTPPTERTAEATLVGAR